MFALVVLAPAAPAAERMQLGAQDDVAMLDQPGAYLDRADQVGAEWARIMAMDNRWPHQADQYVRAAAEAQARGKRVMVSLLAWHSHPTPAQWRAFATDVVARLAPYVDAWSPMNEPNWPGMAPAASTRCVEYGEPSTIAATVRGKKRGWKRVRRGRGRYLRRVTRRHGGRVVRYRKARTRRQRARARWVRIRRAPLRTVVVRSTLARKRCDGEAFGVAYRRIWDAVAPVIEAGDPDATLVVGDLAPATGGLVLFMDAFYGDGSLAVRPVVLGDHYPDGDRARVLVDYARAHGLDPWVTEWALGDGVVGDGFDTRSRPDDWARGLDMLERTGVDVTMIYDTAGPTWDTRMREEDLVAVAAR